MDGLYDVWGQVGALQSTCTISLVQPCFFDPDCSGRLQCTFWSSLLLQQIIQSVQFPEISPEGVAKLFPSLEELRQIPFTPGDSREVSAPADRVHIEPFHITVFMY